jgi:hypothetical protein
MAGVPASQLPSFLFDFQQELVAWALQKGKAAIFADCGLGKTPMQLAWADKIVRYTNRPVLILTPLAVAAQTIREGDKFGIEVRRSAGEVRTPSIIVANYERLHYFRSDDFGGVVCDESSILKSFDGTRRAAITEFMRLVPYRLLCTATAAPNDYVELGTSSEALGELGHMDMLSRFFVNDQHTISPMRKGRFGTHEKGWRFKGHAENAFWQWIASWARAMRKPSDLGCSDGEFILPPLEESHTVIPARNVKAGRLIDYTAIGLSEGREVRRRTIQERVEAAAVKVANTGKPAVVWCHLNAEADLAERLIPGAVQVSGVDSDDAKEEVFEAFRTGQLRVLITKPKIGGYGLNWQHCAHVVYFPSDSYEQYYQAVRRCWRFGQVNRVTVDLIYAEGQENMVANLQRKAKAADAMFAALVDHMNEAAGIKRGGDAAARVVVPAWM